MKGSAMEPTLEDLCLELVAAMVEKHVAETRYYAAVRALVERVSRDD